LGAVDPLGVQGSLAVVPAGIGNSVAMGALLLGALDPAGTGLLAAGQLGRGGLDRGCSTR
jgi:hypothetical protein